MHMAQATGESVSVIIVMHDSTYLSKAFSSLLWINHLFIVVD